MKMKSRILTALLAVIMIVSTSIPVFAANTLGVTYEITLTPEELTVSSSAQTVTMEINATSEIDWDGIQAKIFIPTGFTLKSITNKEVTLNASDYNLNPGAVSGKGSLGFQSESGENEKITNICVVVYEIAANMPAGTYTLGIDELEITKDYGDIWESEGSVSKNLVIKDSTPTPPTPSHPAKPTIAVTGSYTYTGSDITATVTGYDSATMNITGNVGKDAGDYTVKVTSKTGEWADGSTAAVTKSWTIAKADPSFTVPTGLTGTKGSALSTVVLPSGWAWKTPATVMNETGAKTFKAIYTPDDTENYNTKEENLTVTVSEPPAADPAKPVIDVTGTYTYTGSDITATVTGYDSETMNITGNVGKDAGGYTVKVTSKTGKWADGSTAAVTKSWTIAKADPSFTVPTGLTGTKGKALSTVALPSGWAWKTPTTVMDTAGSQTFKAKFTPSNANYNTADNIDITITVTETAPVLKAIAPPKAKTGLVYTGSEQQGVADGTGYTLTGHKATDAGTDYTATATLESGYKWKDGTTAAKNITWSIAKAVPTGKPKYTLITVSGKTLADAALTTTGASFSVPGSVKWTDGDGNELPDTTRVAVNTNYKWLFTPADDGNYETLSGSIRLYSKSSGSVSGGTVAGGTINYTVSFETNGGSKITSRTVARNSTIKEPAAPTKENFDFAGWYTDKEFNTEYNFSRNVTKSFTLYAKWIEKDNSINQIILTIGQKDAKVFGKTVSNDVAPIIVNDRTMLPARFVSENLGATVEWDDAKKLVTVTGKNGDGEQVTILITIGSANALVNGKEIKLDSPAFIENDRTYTPIRFIAEQLGAKVEWDENARKVIITKNAA